MKYNGKPDAKAAPDPAPARPGVAPPVLDVSTWLGSGREAVLTYQGEAYRLRITSNHKLILTK